MSNQSTENNRLPVAPLKIAALENCCDLAGKVNAYLARICASGAKTTDERRRSLHYRDYDADSYLLSINCPRFGTGESKNVINESMRSTDLFVMVDITNYSLTYKVDGNESHMSPDDHFQGLRRIIAASSTATYRVNVIMPFLYEGRQHRRTKRESLDCAYMPTELANMGIENFITFDAHDPRVQNATPPSGFDNFMPTCRFIKACFLNVPDMKADKGHPMIISPDEGATDRAIYISNILGIGTGMFYKRRGYSEVVDGYNPIVAHESLNVSAKDKDVLIIDGMISSGENMMNTAKNLEDRGCKRVIICATFGLFTNSVKNFHEKYDAGIIGYVCTTNLNCRRPKLLEKPWYFEADMNPYLVYIINSLNADAFSGNKLFSTRKIQDLLKNLQNEEYQYFGSIIE